MTLLELIVCLVIGGACGAVACALTGDRVGGFVVSLLVGFVGAFVGFWLAHELHLPSLFVVTIGERAIPLVWSVLGGIVFVVGAHYLTHPRHVTHVDRYVP